MPVPIVCLDEQLRQYLAGYRGEFSKPQWQYFVTVLMGLLLCQESRTLSGLRRTLSDGPSLCGMSRFLASAPWQPDQVVARWWCRFREQLAPLVAAEKQRQRANRPKGRGRPKQPSVTGYLIGDDSTIGKRRGKKMGGLGRHYSTTEGHPIVGHSLVGGLYVLLGRRCPVAPRLYRQQTVCEQEQVPFQSKIDLMIALIQTFDPVAGTVTHVLLDSWYAAKAIWKAARHRGFLITTGLKSNRWVRVTDPDAPKGWRWQRLSDYAATLGEADYQRVWWPSQQGGRWVYAHRLTTQVRSLYRAQVVLVRESLTAPLAQTHYFASSDLQADWPTLIGHLVARWAVEVLFADTKELLGLDHYQLMQPDAIVRFWTLIMVAYLFLDEERARLAEAQHAHVTIGQARREVQHRTYANFHLWLFLRAQCGLPPHGLALPLAA